MQVLIVEDSEDLAWALLGILSHSTLALGLVMVAFMAWVRIDLLSYLFGDLLAVSRLDIAVIWAGGAVVLAILAAVWRPLLAGTVSEELAAAEGLRPERARLVFMLLMAAVIAMAMKIVGNGRKRADIDYLITPNTVLEFEFRSTAEMEPEVAAIGLDNNNAETVDRSFKVFGAQAWGNMTYDDYEAPSFLEVPGAMEVGIEFHSLSKTYNMTGWRIGWAAGRAEVIAALARVKSFVDTGQFLAVQAAASRACELPSRAPYFSSEARRRRSILATHEAPPGQELTSFRADELRIAAVLPTLLTKACKEMRTPRATARGLRAMTMTSVSRTCRGRNAFLYP